MIVYFYDNRWKPLETSVPVFLDEKTVKEFIENKAEVTIKSFVVKNSPLASDSLQDLFPNIVNRKFTIKHITEKHEVLVREI